jgi:lipid II:glycine glycyltransferase (peptidoglycan interpeptide bridge formation enzyme)
MLDSRVAVGIHSKVEEITRPADEWDAFVGSHPHGDVIQTSLWGLSKVHIGRTAILVEARRDNGALAGGALMIESRLCFGARVAYVARGPLVLGDDPSILRVILDTAVRESRRRRVHGLIVQLPEGGSEQSRILDEMFFVGGSMAIAPEATIRIDVTRPDSDILAGMHNSRRRNVRRSWNAGFEIEHSSDVEAFHRLHSATGSRRGFEALSLQYLNSQWLALAPSRAVTILIARHEGQPIAGLWLSRFGEVVTIRLSGQDLAAAAHKYANEAIHWAAFHWARSIGARWCDFGGFDRALAEDILKGGQLAPNFDKTHHYAKLSFGGELTLLPRAHFRIIDPVAHRLTGSLVRTLMRTKFARQLSQRLRSGQG